MDSALYLQVLKPRIFYFHPSKMVQSLSSGKDYRKVLFQEVMNIIAVVLKLG